MSGCLRSAVKLPKIMSFNSRSKEGANFLASVVSAFGDGVDQVVGVHEGGRDQVRGHLVRDPNTFDGFVNDVRAGIYMVL